MTVYIIDREFIKAGGFAFAGAILTFFGLMHGESIGIFQTPTVAIAYVVVALVLVGAAKFMTFSETVPSHHEAEDEAAENAAEEAFEGTPVLT